MPPGLRPIVTLLALLSGPSLAAPTLPSAAPVWKRVYDGAPTGHFVAAPDGRTIVQVGHDGSVWVWRDGGPGRMVRRFDPRGLLPANAMLDNDANLLFVTGPNEVVDPRDGRTVAALPAPPAGTSTFPLAFRHRRAYLLVGWKRLDVLDVDLGRVVRSFSPASDRLSLDPCVTRNGDVVYRSGPTRLQVVEAGTWRDRSAVDLPPEAADPGAGFSYTCHLLPKSLTVRVTDDLQEPGQSTRRVTTETEYGATGELIRTSRHVGELNDPPPNRTYLLEDHVLRLRPNGPNPCTKTERSQGFHPYEFAQNPGAVLSPFALVRLDDGRTLRDVCLPLGAPDGPDAFLDRLWVREEGPGPARLEYQTVVSPGVVRDLDTDATVRAYGETPLDLAVGPCGRFQVVGTGSGGLRALTLARRSDGEDAFDLFTPDDLSRGPHEPPASPSGLAMAWSPDGAALAVTASDKVIVWTVPSAVRRLDCPPPGARATGGEPPSPATRRLFGPTVLNALPAFDPPGARFVRSLAFDPATRRLAVGTNVGDVQIWDVARRQRLWERRLGRTSILGLDWSRHGRLAASTDDGRVWTINPHTNASVVVGPLPPPRTPDRPVEAQPRWIREVRWSPDGADLAVGGSWGDLYRWRPGSAPVKLASTGSAASGFTALRWDPSGLAIAAGRLDGVVVLVDARNGRTRATARAGQDAVLRLDGVNGDYTVLTRDKTVSRWVLRP